MPNTTRCTIYAPPRLQAPNHVNTTSITLTPDPRQQHRFSPSCTFPRDTYTCIACFTKNSRRFVHCTAGVAKPHAQHKRLLQSVQPLLGISKLTTHYKHRAYGQYVFFLLSWPIAHGEIENEQTYMERDSAHHSPLSGACHQSTNSSTPVSYTHLTLPTNREV